MNTYKIQDITKLLNIPASTLRYYEKTGLINNLKRDLNNKRIYKPEDIEWIKFLIRLKKTGMSIQEMKNYSVLRNGGCSTVSERKHLLEKQLNKIESEIESLQEISQYIKEKIEIYNQMMSK
jgi:DNA-binding transcriptional MerR regulator